MCFFLPSWMWSRDWALFSLEFVVYFLLFVFVLFQFLVSIWIHIRIFKKHETYLMELPEDGPKYGPKHVADIKQ
jgi:hypothetical protein